MFSFLVDNLQAQQFSLNTVKKQLGVFVASQKFRLDAVICVLEICRGCTPFTNNNVADKNSVNFAVWRLGSQF